MSAPQGSAAAVSWKCMEVCAALRRGAKLRRSDLREHFYKSCSELREDPTSGAVRAHTIIVMVYKCALACGWDSYQRPQRCESSNISLRFMCLSLIFVLGFKGLPLPGGASVLYGACQLRT